MAHEGLVIGVDLGATNMLLAIVDASHRILHRMHQTTEGDAGFEHVIERLAAGVERLCAASNTSMDDIHAVGVAVAGACDVRRGVVLHAFNLDWYEQPMQDRLEDRLGRPVAIDNDVNAAAWGEHQLGAGRDVSDLFAVWVGTGIGGGLVLNNGLYHGAMSTAGEIGQSVSEPFGPKHQRVVEDFGGREGMKRRFAMQFATTTDSMLHARVNGDASAIGTSDFRSAFEAGDALALDVIHYGADRLGIALANVVSVLSLPLIVFGGGITEALGEPYLNRVRTAFDNAVFPEQCRACVFAMTELRSDAGVLGAALLSRGSTSPCR